MTARQQIRVGRRLRGERAPIDATLAPSVGDLLHAAREKKGVDLYRAERDTKIRARHLSALEDGDYAELPGAVYTKGFLRNYALYLGLDPVEVLERWRDEQEPGQRTAGATAMVPPPQPLTDPRRGLTFTPSLVVAAALSMVVILFLGYVGMQLFRFSQVPELRLDGASLVQIGPEQTSYTLSGVSPVHATVKALDAAGGMVQSVDSDDAGRWSMALAVQKGRNEFSLSARDPETGRDSSSLPVIITVAVPASPTPIPTPAPSSLAGQPTRSADPAGQPSTVPGAVVAGQAALSISTPSDGGRSTDPTVSVKGTSDAPAVRITPTWAGSGKAPGKPESLRLDVKGGDYAGTLVLAQGRWAIEVATVATDALASTTQTVTVNVAFTGFVVEVGTTPKGRAWVQVFIDGDSSPYRPGATLANGERIVVVARQSVLINTGFERATVVGVQGDVPSQLGQRATQGVWRIEKGKAPTRVR